MNAGKLRKRFAAALAVAALAAIVVRAFQPARLKVDVAEVTRGPLETTIDEDGETRAHDRFVIAAPVAGRLLRIDLHQGDSVVPGQAVGTLLPPPIEPHERDSIGARLEAARAAQREAEALTARAEANLEQARRDRQRAEFLASNGDIPAQTCEKARLAEAVASKELVAARNRVEAARSEAAAVRATLESQQTATSQPVTVRSPVRGRVLRIPEPSERVVAQGTPLITLGDVHKLEAVVDVLSTDAVNIRPGIPARLVNWGGANPIPARVKTVEASAFKKVSALGVEEQRVNVVLDILEVPPSLGDGFRVDAQIVVWSAREVTKAPAGTLFRCGSGWCAYEVGSRAAHRREVEVGHRSQSEVEILKGPEAGTRLVLHPPNDLADGARIDTR